MPNDNAKPPIKSTTIPVRPWLFVCFMAVLILAVVSYIYLYVTKEYLPVVQGFAPLPTATPTQTPGSAPLQLTEVAIYDWMAHKSPLPPPLFARGKPPFQMLDFGPGTRVVAYKPEFVIGDARVGSDGTLYVSYMHALLEFVSVGPGAPEPNKLGVLTAGVLRPIPAPWLPNTTAILMMLGTNASPLIFNAGENDYFLDETGVHQLPQRLPDSGRFPPPLGLIEGGRCVRPASEKEQVLYGVSSSGQRWVVLSAQQLRDLRIASVAHAHCYHFARHNIFLFDNNSLNSGGVWSGSIYVSSGNDVRFLADGSVLAADEHRLLIGADAGGNHQWLLEGFAL
jgi:hypothetical protein